MAKKFIQIIEFDSDQLDEMKKLDDQYEQDTKGRATQTRAMMCADLDNPGHYYAIVEFPSRADAEKNDALPETQKFAEAAMKLSKNTKFHNLEIQYEQGS